MANISINPDSKILGLLEYLQEAGKGTSINPVQNMGARLGRATRELLLEPQEYQSPVFNTGQSQQISDLHNAMNPEVGSKQSMLLPFGYDAEGNIEPAVPSLLREVGQAVVGLLGEYEKAQSGTGYQDIRDITPQETANTLQGMIEVMTGGLLDNAPKSVRSGISRSGDRGLLNNDLDDLGFYSPTERLASNLQPKGTGQQYLGILAKGDGQGSRIAEEMQDMGLDTWLQNRGKVSRDEVLDYIGENRLRYGNTIQKDGTEAYNRAIADSTADELEMILDNDYGLYQSEAEIRPFIDAYRSSGGTDREAVEWLENYYSRGGYEGTGNGYIDMLERQSRDGLDRGSVEGAPKYQQYAQTGGTDYQENLLTVPNADNGYQSSHYDPANIGLTTRTQSFNTPDGKKVHLMDELQSDWHSDGRSKGYAGQESPRFIELRDRLRSGEDLSTQEWGEYNKLHSIASGVGDAVPNAPAKKSWMNQGIKKELNQTIKDGKDYFAWTGGDIQARRYDLSNQVDGLRIDRIGDNKYEVWGQEKGTTNYMRVDTDINGDDLHKYVGKDLSEKALKDIKDKPAASFTAEGVDLEVGGEGMKGFYDKDVRKRTEKIIKKLDPNAKVEVIELDNGNKVWGVKITDKMRGKVKTEGMPLYSGGKGVGLLNVGTQTSSGLLDNRENNPQLEY